MSININQLIDDIKSVSTDILERDIITVRGFSERQLKAIALQVEIVGTGISNGQITEETREYFLDNIEDMVLSFLNTLRGILLVTIEKLLNAIIGVIWKAIKGLTGIALPI